MTDPIPGDDVVEEWTDRIEGAKAIGRDTLDGCSVLEIEDILQKLREVKAENERLSGLVYVPGVWQCAKCRFQLVQSTLNARDGTVTARDVSGEKCPNCDVSLWRCTYRDEYKHWADAVDQFSERAFAAEAKLAALTEALRPACEAVGKATPGPWRVVEDTRSQDFRHSKPSTVLLICGPNGVPVISRRGLANPSKSSGRAVADFMVAAEQAIRQAALLLKKEENQ